MANVMRVNDRGDVLGPLAGNEEVVVSNQEELRDGEDAKLLATAANDKVCNIVHLIYRAKKYEGAAKDFEFSRRTMEEHWNTGYANARETLSNPQVLELRWTVAAYEQDWTAGLEIARAHLKTAPELLGGWIHQAYSLRRVDGGGLQAAWDALFPAMAKFPEESLIPYNLACYACQLQQPDKARVLLARAMALGGSEEIKRMALKDSDLKPLWSLIKGF